MVLRTRMEKGRWCFEEEEESSMAGQPSAKQGQ
jgi:hypothetical protein